MPDIQPQHGFRISSFCQDGGCVEVAWGSRTEVLVRDKKNPDSPIVPVGVAAWRRFLHGIPEGEACHG